MDRKEKVFVTVMFMASIASVFAAFVAESIWLGFCAALMASAGASVAAATSDAGEG